VNKFIDTAQAADGRGLDVEVGGQAVQQAEQPPMGLSELVGIAAAALVLYLAFGSLFGMLLPILTAIFGVGTSVSAIAVLSTPSTSATSHQPWPSLVGLGVASTYACSSSPGTQRHPARLSPERPPSGGQHLGAGGAVRGRNGVHSAARMFAVGLTFLNGLAIGASLTVIVTVRPPHPACPRCSASRARCSAAASGAGSHTARKRGGDRRAARWSGFDPAAPACCSPSSRVAAVMHDRHPDALAAPRLVRQWQQPGDDDHRKRTTCWPPASARLQRPADDPPPKSPAARPTEGPGRLVADIRTQRAWPGHAMPLQKGATVAWCRSYRPPHRRPSATDDLIDRLRGEVIRLRKGQHHAGVRRRATAIFKDFAHVITGKTPLFIGVIIARASCCCCSPSVVSSSRSPRRR